MKLEHTLGHAIGQLCPNGFHDAAANHCAHYVCHVLGVDAGYDCRTHTGKPGAGATLRVHELFAHCPRVGLFQDVPPGICVVFVTARTNVDLNQHLMRNVPQKHVGLYDGTHIYHYSNTQDQVIREAPAEFLARFQAAYTGDQALYFGTLPPEAQVPESGVLPLADAATTLAGALPVPPRPRVTSRVVAGQRTEYYARIDDGPEFYVARKVRYQGRVGLTQPSGALDGPVYSAQDYTALYGPVAALIGVIAAGESGGRFNRLNSFDRAAFTFGFFQLAAHTPDDNLILLFRRLVVEHPGFQRHFPDLLLREGRLHRSADGITATKLEREYPRPDKPEELILKDFMAYLNPDALSVDTAEIDAAARLVALAQDAAFNALQVRVAAEITMSKLRRRYDAWYTLDGRSDLICTAIADIHHQSRGGKQAVRQALAQPTLEAQLESLCRIGRSSYPERCETLRTALAQARADGLLGHHVFDRASGLFRPAQGWVA